MSFYSNLVNVLNLSPQQQKSVAQPQQVQGVEQDWRVRLHLSEADGVNYLYRAPNPGILAPLAETRGIIFPYTPEISIQYNASYQNYDLVHSNYRGYFYTGSQVQNIIITADFTANDVYEANYLLASLHFLRTATKMFYGNDVQRGSPPPVLFLSGLGEYHFNNHPCVITMFSYNLPRDVDYIPCGVINTGTTTSKTSTNSNPIQSRLSTAGLQASAESLLPQAENNTVDNNGPVKIYDKATYVPTKISLNFSMIPIQTRTQVSTEFSLQDYASGALLKKGFW